MESTATTTKINTNRNNTINSSSFSSSSSSSMFGKKSKKQSSSSNLNELGTNGNNCNIKMKSSPPLVESSCKSVPVGGTDSSTDPTINNFISVSTAREREGKCITCGQRLYSVKPKKNGITTFWTRSSDITNTKDVLSNEEFFKQYKRIALTIPGKVERGQCLLCGTSTTMSGSFGATEPSSVGSSSGITVVNELTHLMIDDDVVDHDEAVVSGYAEFVNAQRTNYGATATSASATTNNSNNRTSPVPTSNNVGTDTNAATANNSNGSGVATALYKGPYNAAGKRHGHGKMTWSNNGDIYIGDFVNGDRHGNGTLHFGGVDGGEYVGEWRHNQMAGLGTRRWPNGDVYTGDYLAGKRTGNGRFYFANGDLYTGEFYCDKIHGFGRYYYANGQRFEGYFSNGKRLGKGKIQRIDGTLDIGIYRNDVRVGLGIRWSPDRTETWKLENGIVKKKITVPEAVSLDYELEAAAAQIAADGEVL